MSLSGTVYINGVQTDVATANKNYSGYAETVDSTVLNKDTLLKNLSASYFKEDPDGGYPILIWE